MKRCSKCGEEKPFAEFTGHLGCVDGLRPECKACIARYNAEYRAKHREELLPKQRAARDANREQILLARRKPCLRCGGPKGDGERRRYCDACRPFAQEQAKARDAQLRNRHRPRKQAAFVEDIDPLVLLEMDDGVCGICGEDVDPFDFQVDHIWPLVRGGLHSYANTQPAHPLCNARKGMKVPV